MWSYRWIYCFLTFLETIQYIHLWCSSPCPFFRCFVLALHRANSARNLQIEELAGAWLKPRQADRSINSQFHPMILKFISTSNRADSTRNRQINEFGVSQTFLQLSNRSISSQFYPMILKPVHHLPFFAALSWLCIGPIPPEIVKLTKLRDLRLFRNKLTGR